MAVDFTEFQAENFRRMVGNSRSTIEFLCDDLLPKQLVDHQKDIRQCEEDLDDVHVKRRVLDCDRDEIERECEARLEHVDKKIAESDSEKLFVEARLRNAKKMAQEVAEDLRIGSRIKLPGAEKPMAVWTLPNIRNYFGIRNIGNVRQLGWQAATDLLQASINMGYEHNVSCPAGGVPTKNAPTNFLQDKVIELFDVPEDDNIEGEIDAEETRLLEALATVRKRKQSEATARSGGRNKKARYNGAAPV